MSHVFRTAFYHDFKPWKIINFKVISLHHVVKITFLSEWLDKEKLFWTRETSSRQRNKRDQFWYLNSLFYFYNLFSTQWKGAGFNKLIKDKKKWNDIMYESWEWVRKLFLVDLAEDVICIFSIVLLVAIVFAVIVFAKSQFYFRFIFVFPISDQLNDAFWTWVSVTLFYVTFRTWHQQEHPWLRVCHKVLP